MTEPRNNRNSSRRKYVYVHMDPLPNKSILPNLHISMGIVAQTIPTRGRSSNLSCLASCVSRMVVFHVLRRLYNASDNPATLNPTKEFANKPLSTYFIANTLPGRTKIEGNLSAQINKDPVRGDQTMIRPQLHDHSLCWAMINCQF